MMMFLSLILNFKPRNYLNNYQVEYVIKLYEFLKQYFLILNKMPYELPSNVLKGYTGKQRFNFAIKKLREAFQERNFYNCTQLSKKLGMSPYSLSIQSILKPKRSTISKAINAMLESKEIKLNIRQNSVGRKYSLFTLNKGYPESMEQIPLETEQPKFDIEPEKQSKNQVQEIKNALDNLIGVIVKALKTDHEDKITKLLTDSEEKDKRIKTLEDALSSAFLRQKQIQESKEKMEESWIAKHLGISSNK